MAQVTTVDVTSVNGNGTFPLNTNDVYGLVETIATQNIRSVATYNRIEDGFYDYDVEDGKVIEEAIIEAAKAQAFAPDTPNFNPVDPEVHVNYFNNYEAKQFVTTVRRNDIRKIIANKGIGTDEVVAQILDTLTKGEGVYDFDQMRNALLTANVKDYAAVIGGKPASMKGVLYAIRDAYNHLKSNNSDLTGDAFVSATPEKDIRIAITPKLLNLIDVVELANVFNLEKEELFGKLVVVDTDDLTSRDNDYKVLVYDRKAFGRATRLYEYSQDILGSTLYSKHYLTTERAYFHNDLFKAARIDCTAAATSAKAELITAS